MNSVASPVRAEKANTSARTVRLSTSAHGHKLLTITDPRAAQTLTTAYHLEQIDAGMGRRGFRLSKVERPSGTDKSPKADAYHVLTAPEGTACECRGFLRHGHCKHCESLVALERPAS